MKEKKKKGKLRPFARRLTRRIVFTQLIVMGLASYLIYEFCKEIVRDEEISLYKSYLSVTHEKVRRVIDDVYLGTVNHVPEIEEHLDQPDRMPDIMYKVVSLNPHIRSCGISFVEGYYPQKGRWFCPYAVKGDNGVVVKRVLGDAKHDYLKADWFTQALKANEGYWSKPFFDSTDSVTPLVSYMVPIRDKQGNTVAILGADLSLEWFRGNSLKVNHSGDSINIYFGGNSNVSASNSDDDAEDRSPFSRGIEDSGFRLAHYNFIIDGDGTFIAHPDSNRIIRDNYFKLAKETTDTIDDYVGRQMVAGANGTYCDKEGDPTSFDFFDMGSFSAYVFYRPVKHTDWSIAITVPRVVIDWLAIGCSIVLLIVIALGLFVGHIVGRFTIRRATKPLNQLAASANEVAKGNFSTPLPRIKHNDEIKLLRDSFEGMQHSLGEYINELKTTTAAKASLENELKVAHDIQMSMLPKIFPPYPERHDIDIYGTLTPAKDVGGDLFDFYIRDEKLFFCIGDVSGKGVPASLVMAVTRSLFRNISAHVSKPDHIAMALNNAMVDGNETNMFVTLFIGMLDLQDGHLYYCNAGHDSPLLIGRGVGLLPCDSNLPIGVMPNWEFTPQDTVVDPGTTIFLYTDGLNEAENASHDQFGIDRVTQLSEVLLSQGRNLPTILIDQMTIAVHDFVGEAEPSDDLTMLAIKYTGTK